MSMKHSCLLPCLFIFLAPAVNAFAMASSPTPANGDQDCAGIEIKVPLPVTKVGNGESHGATLLAMKDKLFLAWFYGGEKKPDSQILFTEFLGGQWNAPVEIANGIRAKDRTAVWNPILMQDQNYIILFYKTGPIPQAWTGQAKISSDLGASWSNLAMTEKFNEVIGPTKTKPMRLNNGQWLVPSSIETPTTRHVQLEYYDANWNFLRVEPFNEPLNVKLIQPLLLRHPKTGCIQMLTRSQQKVAVQSFSCDEGETWSKLERSEIPNPDSSIDGLILEDGRSLIVHNDLTSGRNRLALSISSDSGKSWQRLCVLKKGDYFAELSYPSIAIASDGSLHVAYTFKRKRINHVILDLKKIGLKE
jgi:predicted neuraminidase